VKRLYKTKTKTYSETDLVVVVWKNPKKSKRPQSRHLETMSSNHSSYPMAFPLDALINHRAWSNSKRISTSADFEKNIDDSSRNCPLLLDLTLAANVLGWTDFYIPEEYTEYGI
jgi:hypothetical protein